MSTIIDQLKALHCAEDFFAALDVAFEPRVLRVARLHILRRMGEALRNANDWRDGDEEVRRRCRDALSAAYEEFTRKAPIETRLFKVLRDRDPARPPRDTRPFVPFSALLGEGS